MLHSCSPRRLQRTAWDSYLRHLSTATPPWRPAAVLDSWVRKEARPISLKQLTFFGRTLTESRLLSAANYVRMELPTRLAHRIRDMQTLPYVVVTNPHISHVYELYYKAFEALRRVRPIQTVEDNDKFCALIAGTLKEHLTVIPNLAMGVLECQDLMRPEDTDKFMSTLLRSRISRRVIGEQHLALTRTLNLQKRSPARSTEQDLDADCVGEVFLRCNAREVVERCGSVAQEMAKQACDTALAIPEIKLQGHLKATFPYILSHLEYIIGELLRNSIQAVAERFEGSAETPPPIEVLICEAPQHVIFRISDQGGGIPREILPYLWSFSKGPRKQARLQNLHQVPKMAATMQELGSFSVDARAADDNNLEPRRRADSSLGSLTSRPPNLRLGMGLPMSRVYAEYWAGSLELHSLEGYGVDAFLQISKLGNRNEQLSTRASMDAV